MNPGNKWPFPNRESRKDSLKKAAPRGESFLGKSQQGEEPWRQRSGRHKVGPAGVMSTLSSTEKEAGRMAGSEQSADEDQT